MDKILDLFRWLLDLLRDPGPQIAFLGYPGLALIVFLETGAMVFFLPGDSLLVVAGMYGTPQIGALNVWILMAILIPCAVIGDATSYWIGAKTGPRIFNKPKSRFFNPAHVKAAHDFYLKHGGKAIILARFMPLVRTFVPVIAGVAKMPYRRFAMFNIIGGAAWVISMVLGGYYGSQLVPDLHKHVEKVIIVVVLVSISPGIIAWLRARKTKD
jgi:membrane-associated protein